MGPLEHYGICRRSADMEVHDGSNPAGLGLALKLAVIAERRAVDLLDDELADGHVGIERDVEGAKIDQFERDRPGEPRMMVGAVKCTSSPQRA